jgi:IS1 family transposase
LEPRQAHTEEEKAMILRAYKERASMRGIERIFNVVRQTVARWIKEIVQALPDLKDSLQPAQPDDVLELDELWSFVLKKDQKRWLWTAMCRRTRQIVAFVIGDRSRKTCRRLWNKIPQDYKACHSFSDFWEAYQQVFPKETHRCVGKETGQTAHMERWYNTLRQRLARFVRKTLSFSKSDAYHHMVTKWFIVEYNLALLSLTN